MDKERRLAEFVAFIKEFKASAWALDLNSLQLVSAIEEAKEYEKKLKRLIQICQMFSQVLEKRLQTPEQESDKAEFIKKELIPPLKNRLSFLNMCLHNQRGIIELATETLQRNQAIQSMADSVLTHFPDA